MTKAYPSNCPSQQQRLRYCLEFSRPKPPQPAPAFLFLSTPHLTHGRTSLILSSVHGPHLAAFHHFYHYHPGIQHYQPFTLNDGRSLSTGLLTSNSCPTILSQQPEEALKDSLQNCPIPKASTWFLFFLGRKPKSLICITASLWPHLLLLSLVDKASSCLRAFAFVSFPGISAPLQHPPTHTNSHMVNWLP